MDRGVMSHLRLGAMAEKCEEAIRLKPSDAEAHCSLGVACLALGNHGAALDQYRIVKGLDPGRTDRFFNSIRKCKSRPDPVRQA